MDECTWEARENLTCEELIEAFEEEERQKQSSGRSAGRPRADRTSRGNDVDEIRRSETPIRNDYSSDPFADSFKSEPAEITEVGQRNGQLSFKLKWTGDHGSDWIPVDTCNLRVPHLVLRYYKELLASGKVCE